MYNLLSGELRLSFGGGWTLGAQTSYDLLALEGGRDPWSLLNLNLEYAPAEWLRGRLQLRYDPNRERWRSLQTDLLWRFGDSQLALAALRSRTRPLGQRVPARGRPQVGTLADLLPHAI